VTNVFQLSKGVSVRHACPGCADASAARRKFLGQHVCGNKCQLKFAVERGVSVANASLTAE
jgi:ribosomal protein L37AE/L43A